MLVYPNGAKVLARDMMTMETYPRQQCKDRSYITKLFKIFAIDYMWKQVSKGRTREEALEKIRKSKLHDTMHGSSYILI